jgi:NAD(P)-dependent dehydrogenase (short-subunit alcohol dehydrogenase family)
MPKTAVVTGAAGGIGKAVVERFSREDIASILLDIDDSGGKKIAATLQQQGKQATFIRLDVTHEADVQSTFERIQATHRKIDILVNVAGGSMHRHSVDDFPLAHWQAIIDLNLTGTFLCCRAAAALMKAQKSGVVVNVSSDIAFSGDAGRSAYAAAKAGILGLTRSLALELAPFGARANTVAPGRIATPRVRAGYSDTEWDAAAERIPLGHAGEAEDVAETVAFLVSDAARHFTGQTLHVNGGRIMT